MGTAIYGIGTGDRTVGAAAGGLDNLDRLRAQSPTPASGNGSGASKLDAARVRTLVLTEVSRNWQACARRYPEAFKHTTGISAQSAPKVVFWSTRSAFVKAMGRSATETTVAMVDSKKPNVVNVNMENLLKYSAVRGDDYIRATVAHELIHSLAAPQSLRMFKDGDPLSETALATSLNKEFSLDPTHRPRQRTTFTVEQMVNEFSADYFSAKVTGIAPLNAAYKGIRDVGLQTLKRVGETTWRKAIFENDTVAYRQVISAALAVRQNYLPREERRGAGSAGNP